MSSKFRVYFFANIFVVFKTSCLIVADEGTEEEQEYEYSYLID